MKIQTFIENNLGLTPRKLKCCSSVYQDVDGNFYSYGPHYPLLFKVNGHWVVNRKPYSVSTSRHTAWATRPAEFSVNLLGRDISLSNVVDSLNEEIKLLNKEINNLKRRGTKKENELTFSVAYVKWCLHALKNKESNYLII